MEFRSNDIKPVDFDEKGRIVSFYVVTWDNENSYGEIFLKGSADQTIKENFARIKHLKNHDRKMAPGVIKELVDDGKGLIVRSKLIETTIGEDTLIEYKEGQITEHSIGFDYKSGGYNIDKDGKIIINNFQLWEASSLNSWGADKNTGVISLNNSILTYERLVKSLINKL